VAACGAVAAVAVNWSQVEGLRHVGIGEGIDQPDVAAAYLQQARLAELKQYCPALPIAWMVLTVLGQPVVVCTPQLEPLGPPITDTEVLLDALSEAPRAPVGVLTGQRPEGWSLVGIRCDRWGAWQTWYYEHTVASDQVEDGYGKMVERRWGRPCGKPGAVMFQTPPPPQFTSQSITGRNADFDMNIKRHPAGPDWGGWITWAAVADGKGRLPSFKGRRLADGVETLPDGAVLPIYWRDGVGRVAQMEGLTIHPQEGEGCPPWFASLLGGRF
jgi:hypothetical protein